MSLILLVEDDQNLGFSLKRHLEDEGLQTHLANNLETAQKFIQTQTPELIILDWMLPDGQGIDFLRQLRADKIHLPVIMLTARTELIDKVLGLETGANDYLTKPFEPRELVARIRVQLRDFDPHKNVHENPQIELGELCINKETRETFYAKQLIDTTKMEFELLKLLAENPNRAFSREEILNKVWGYENYPTTRTVDTHVLQIRQKFPADLIETVRGIGYKLRYQA